MTLNTLAAAVAFLATAASALSITPSGNADTLAKAILGSGPGIKLISASYAGSPDGSGSYTGGPQGIRDGAVLTSGNAVDTIIGPGTSGDIDRTKNTPGSALCSALAGGAPSFDAAVLTMQVELLSGFTGFFSEFVFASEEYPEWVGSEFNDVFGIYVDGKQIAFDDTNSPITINGPFFKSSSVLVPPASGSSFDGSTPILKSGHVAPVGTHKIEIAICDISDTLRDSSVFVTLGACTGECKSGTTISPCAGKGGDSDNDGICDHDDNCPFVHNPDQNPAACLTTGGPKHNITTTTPKHNTTTPTTPPCITLTSYVTHTITTCTQKTVCHPTTTVKPVVWTSTISLTVTTPCSTYTVTKCPGGPGSPCHTYTNTVTLAPKTTPVHIPQHHNTTVVVPHCPGGPHCPSSSHYLSPLPSNPPAPVCPGGPNCYVPSPTPVPVCPGGTNCPPTNKTTTTFPPTYTGAAARAIAGTTGLTAVAGLLLAAMFL